MELTPEETRSYLPRLQAVEHKIDELLTCVRKIQHHQSRDNVKLRHDLYMLRAQLRSQANSSVPADSNKRVRFVADSYQDGDLEDGDAGISGDEYIHRECLQENFQLLTSELNLISSSDILDELVEGQCLSEDESARIGDKSDRKDQTRKLIILLSKRSSTTFVNFMEILQRYNRYPHVAEQLRKAYDDKIAEGRRKTQCLTCGIKRDVSLKDIVDKLFEHKIIDLEFLDLVSSENSGNQADLWEILFLRIGDSASRYQDLKVLAESLATKYEHIAAKVQLVNELSCRCGYECPEIDFQSRMSYPDSTCSSHEIQSSSGVSKMDRQTSTTWSLSSQETQEFNELVSDPLPRTFQWVLESPETDQESMLPHTDATLFRNTENENPLRKRSSSFQSQATLSSPTMTDKVIDTKGSLSSLAGIGDQMMLDAAKEESVKIYQNQDIVDKCSSLITATPDLNVAKCSKTKKKKKRIKHNSEPSSSHFQKSMQSSSRGLRLDIPNMEDNCSNSQIHSKLAAENSTKPKSNVNRMDNPIQIDEPHPSSKAAEDSTNIKSNAKRMTELFYDDLSKIKPKEERKEDIKMKVKDNQKQTKCRYYRQRSGTN